MTSSSPKTLSRIVGTGRALPSKVLSNLDLEKMVETSDAWIVERTGIRERRVLEEGRVTSDLAAESAKKAIAAAGLTPADIDCTIVATVTPDRTLPATAVTVQQKVGIPSGTAAFDIAAACAGFIYGMTVADAFITRGQFKNVLVVGVEILSRIVDYTDRNTCILFGDGAGAAVLSRSPDDRHGLLSTHLYADGATADILYIEAGGTACPTSPETAAARKQFVKMNGRAVFSQAVRNLAKASMAALEANHVTVGDVDWVVAHQANLRIIEGVAERMGLGLDRFFLNIEKTGNTSSASIPIALDEAIEQGVIKPGQLVLMCALGGGLAWGSALVRM
jgi:3-oxoacyl-[acyl-carrier-protein] synthase-3